MLLRIEDKEVEDAAERVRRKRGDRSRTATASLLILEADRGPCQASRGDGRVCGAPVGIGDAVCTGCVRSNSAALMRPRKGAKS